MADLTNSQSTTPVEVSNETSGNTLAIQSDGSVSSRLLDGAGSSVAKGQTIMAGSLPVTIASDQSTIPVSIGLPPYLNSTFGYAVSINQPNAGADDPLIFIKNPTASGKTLYLKFISYGVSVTNVYGIVRVWKNPTVSANGTARTIVPFGSGTTAMELYTVPTVTSSGTLIHDAVSNQNNNSLLMDFAYEVQLAPNSALLITGEPASNNRQAEISVRWLEI